MTPEQTAKAVLLDYVTEWQTNDEPWREFLFLSESRTWYECNKDCNPLHALGSDTVFRRRPKAITVTMSVPENMCKYSWVDRTVLITYTTEEMADTALAAIRAEMEKGK